MEFNLQLYNYCFIIFIVLSTQTPSHALCEPTLVCNERKFIFTKYHGPCYGDSDVGPDFIVPLYPIQWEVTIRLEAS
jgi:hypothetical protein